MSDFLFGILDIVVLEFYVCGFHFFSEKCFVFFFADEEAVVDVGT